MKRKMRLAGLLLRVIYWLLRLQKGNKNATYNPCKAHAIDFTALAWGERIAIYCKVNEEGQPSERMVVAAKSATRDAEGILVTPGATGGHNGAVVCHATAYTPTATLLDATDSAII